MKDRFDGPALLGKCRLLGRHRSCWIARFATAASPVCRLQAARRDQPLAGLPQASKLFSMRDGYQGLPRSERWGCFAGLLIGGPVLLFLLGLDAVGDFPPTSAAGKAS